MNTGTRINRKKDTNMADKLTWMTAVAAVCGGLAGCGGGGADDGGTAPPPTEGAASAPTLAQRQAAAQAAAQSTTNHCSTIGNFYWEVGDRSTGLASGSVTPDTTQTAYTADSVMSIASASKWIYGAYVVQRQAALTDDDVKFLTFRSGYTDFQTCLPGQTVDQCDAMLNNGTYEAANDGKFYYNGGHMEKHATLLGLGGLDSAALADEIRSQVGRDVVLAYSQPQLAGGVVTSPTNYARFLRKLMDGTLKLGSQLGTHAVCTNPSTCSTAVYTPIPQTESDHYSLGHWVEDDPQLGDGSFSSAGAFGFYPWIDSHKQYYGIVARRTPNEGSGYDSAQCGRDIRAAWMSGKAQ